uniref:UDP-glucuronosyltransferase n=1 Tax=Denticeps clupeoides TaxID=299321 RepID=A0AAY3ZY82_9TELE
RQGRSKVMGPFPIHITHFLLLALPLACHSDRILVFSVDGSHWINMKVLLRELHSRGHHLTVVRQSDSWFIHEHSPHYSSVTVKLPEKDIGLEIFEDATKKIIESQRKGLLMGSIAQVREMIRILKLAHSATCSMLSVMLENKVLMRELDDANFDLMLTDPAMPAGVILAHYLHLPMVYNARWMSFGEVHFSIAPSPISYVPVPGSGLTDQMNFLQRFKNLFHYFLNFLQERWLVVPTYTDLLHKHFPPGADLLAMQQAADLWLIRVDFVLEFPRPGMPNLVYIGGFQCRPAEPLPSDLESFVQSSEKYGVVVISFGTLISTLPEDMTEAIATALAHLPQKVVWRFQGKRPSSLGNNTLLLDWIPQNDLLGHSKTCVFVAHGGTNGIYEAIYHGIPILGLPLLFDQMDNLVRLQTRGAAQIVSTATLTAETFSQGLREVLLNKSYRRNMQRLSRLHRDQPFHPLDKAVFWTEFVLRNKGAPHLHTDAYSMPWYSYYSMDVAALLMAVILGGLFPCILLIRVTWNRLKMFLFMHCYKQPWLTISF